MKRVIVIGAGVAGLAAAARLQHAGYEVTLFEKEPLVGGKMNQIREEGFTFDVGPTIVMMPELYREVFETCGRNADDYIPMEKVEPLMDISFGPGDRLRLSNDLASMTSSTWRCCTSATSSRRTTSCNARFANRSISTTRKAW